MRTIATTYGVEFVGGIMPGVKKKTTPAPAPVATPAQPITRTIIDASTQQAPATQTTATAATAANTRSTAAAAQSMQEANSTAAGSAILAGSAGTGGGYQGTEDVPMGAAGQDNQFLRRMGSILLR